MAIQKVFICCQYIAVALNVKSTDEDYVILSYWNTLIANLCLDSPYDAQLFELQAGKHFFAHI